MATKKDLQQAQAYSQQRVLTAFTSGIPGGKELEPSNPMRTVIAAVALAILLVIGSLIFGLIKPGLPAGWDNNKLLLSNDTGARYISISGTLYPVLNTTSARLMIPAADYSIITIDESRIADVPRGGTIGILGAPDELPRQSALVQDGWTSCVVGNTQRTSLLPAASSSAKPVSGAVIAQLGNTTYLVDGTTSYALSNDGTVGLLRAIGMDTATPIPVTAQWLDLFASGTPLAPLTVPGTGETVSAGDLELRVGAAVHPEGDPDDTRYLVLNNGTVASLTPFAYQLYRIAGGPEAVDVSPVDLAQFPDSSVEVSASDWPLDVLEPAALEADSVCAILDTDGSAPQANLGTATSPEELANTEQPILISPTGGAIVTAIGTGDPNGGQYYLVDGTGTAYPVPGANKDILGQLGFAEDDVTKVPQSWISLFVAGPALTAEAAGNPPSIAEAAPVVGTGDTTDEGDGSGDASADAVADAGADDECVVNAQFTSTVPPALAVLQNTLANSRATGKGIVVAVVDSGVDATNAHLDGVVLEGVNLVDDGEPADGRTDLAGHGTAIAALIAGQKVEGSGIVGLAPGAKILPVRVFRGTDSESVDAGFGPKSKLIAAGIRYAADHDADIINVSMSESTDQVWMQTAVNYAENSGSLIVASAGNRTTAVDQTDGARYPAAYSTVLGVAAADSDLVVNGDSIRGPQVSVAAPGSDIYSAAAGGKDCLYATEAASTSYATGYTSAAAALVAQEFPTASPAAWKYRLTATASRAGPDHRDDVTGWGLIQPYDALTAVLDGTTRGPDNPTAERVVAETAPVETVSANRAIPAIEATKAVALWVGVIGGTLLALFALIARLRQSATSARQLP